MDNQPDNKPDNQSDNRPDNQAEDVAAEGASNGAQVAYSEVHDITANNEEADRPPMSSRINEMRGEVNGERIARISSRTSRISQGMLRGRRNTLRNVPTSGEARRNATQSREARCRRQMTCPSTLGSIRDIPGGFTLASADYCVNPNFVEPGYAELNPEYAQRANSRPVWGLARPLPRVVRKAMVPTALEKVHVHGGKSRKKPTDVDLEAGRLEKHRSRLDRLRAERERSYFCKKHGTVHANDEEHDQDVAYDYNNGEADIGLVQPSEALTVLDGEDDNASSITEAHEVEDADLMQNRHVIDDVPLLNCGLMENHNHHTHWAVIRSNHREFLAELLAVTVQLTLGFCSNLSVTLGNNQFGFTTCWAWGLSTMIGIYIAGGISGAHLNPAVSIMLWIYRGFPVRKIPAYVLAQTLGAFIAALISFGLYRVDIIEYYGKDLAAGGTAIDFVTFPRYPFVSAPTAFFNEFVGTAFLAITIMALGDDSNAPPGAGLNSFVLGFVVTIHGISFGKNTGAALNPSRDFGPRLALLALGYGKELFTDLYWVWGPWCATISGAIFGAGIYDTMIFVGGESPINYPRCRMKRAAKLWKGRVYERCQRVPRKLGIKRRRGGKVQQGETREKIPA